MPGSAVTLPVSLPSSWPAEWNRRFGPWRGDGTAGWVSVVVHHIPAVPGQRQSAAPEPDGIRDALCAPHVPASPSHREAAAIVYWGAAAAGGIWAAALAGLLIETALQAEGRCQRLCQPLCCTWELLLFPFPAVFALVCSGKPRSRGHGCLQCHSRGAKPILEHGEHPCGKPVVSSIIHKTFTQPGINGHGDAVAQCRAPLIPPV